MALTIKTRFRIQTHAYIAATYLPALIAGIRSLSPSIVFDLQSITSTSDEHMEKGDTDLIVGAGLKANQQFRQAVFAEDQLCCLVDNRHLELEEWTPANVFNYAHIKMTLLEDHNDPVTIYILRNDLAERQVGLYTETLHMQPSFLADTNLIAFIPLMLARQAAKTNSNLRIMSCPFELPALQVKAIWHKRSENDAIHSWIRSRLLQADE